MRTLSSPLLSQKNPLDDLPKSAFNLEEWKRQYSNLDTKDALKWFYEKCVLYVVGQMKY